MTTTPDRRTTRGVQVHNNTLDVQEIENDPKKGGEMFTLAETLKRFQHTGAGKYVWVSKRHRRSEIVSPDLSVALPVHKLVLLCLRTGQNYEHYRRPPAVRMVFLFSGASLCTVMHCLSLYFYIHTKHRLFCRESI